MKHYSSIYFFVRWQNNFEKIKKRLLYACICNTIDIYLYGTLKLKDMTELFELQFVDGTKIIAAEQNNNVVYSTIGGGLSDVFKREFNKIEYRYICAFAYKISNESEFVCGYRDLVAENSDKVETELLSKTR